jgi:hypothetical protein
MTVMMPRLLSCVWSQVQRAGIGGGPIHMGALDHRIVGAQNQVAAGEDAVMFQLLPVLLIIRSAAPLMSPGRFHAETVLLMSDCVGTAPVPSALLLPARNVPLLIVVVSLYVLAPAFVRWASGS